MNKKNWQALCRKSNNAQTESSGGLNSKNRKKGKLKVSEITNNNIYENTFYYDVQRPSIENEIGSKKNFVYPRLSTKTSHSNVSIPLYLFKFKDGKEFDRFIKAYLLFNAHYRTNKYLSKTLKNIRKMNHWEESEY